MKIPTAPPCGLKPAMAALALWLVATAPAQSATVWDGPIVTFFETSTDWTDPTSQDRMTPKVWITRGAIQGIFNAFSETNFTHFSSPADTRWANGFLTNYATLSYTDWNTWAKGVNPNPPSTVNVPAVVHLVSENIYVGIKFTFWGGSGGLFAYERTSPPVARIPLSITRLQDKVVLAWNDPSFSLQSATNVAGPYTTIAGATSPYTNSVSGTQMHFRLIH